MFQYWLLTTGGSSAFRGFGDLSQRNHIVVDQAEDGEEAVNKGARRQLRSGRQHMTEKNGLSKSRRTTPPSRDRARRSQRA